jgi:hypothetical protein
MPIVGTKTTEFVEAASMADTDQLLANIDGRSSRIPKSAIPELAADIVFLTGGDNLTVTQAEHYRKFINANNTNGDVTITLPALASVDKFGLFGVIGGTSGNFDIAVTCAESGVLRGMGPYRSTPTSADTFYLGAKRSMADECIARVYRRGGLWTVDCNTSVRLEPDGDNFIIPGSQVNKTLTTDGSGAYQIGDGDHEEPVWLTTAGATVLTFQSDIAVGVRTTIVNAGSDSGTFSAGSHTIVGDVTILPGQAASVIVGPTVSGDNRSIFIATSS